MSDEPLKTIHITGIEKLKPRVIDVEECQTYAELRAENERLKEIERRYRLLSEAINEDSSVCDTECDSHGHTESCRYVSTAALIEDRQSEIERLKNQLAARDADVNALREWLHTKEHDCSKRGWFTICAAFRQVISHMDELPTMKDVK